MAMPDERTKEAHDRDGLEGEKPRGFVDHAPFIDEIVNIAFDVANVFPKQPDGFAGGQDRN